MASPALDREAVEQAVARGSELLKQGKLDDAQKAFRAALLLDGENARVLALLGLTHFRAGQFAQARPIYEELVERAPTDASHRLNLGLVYLKLGDSDKAIGSLEASRALDPSQGRAVSYLGLAYARAGRYAEAYRSFLLAGQNDLASEIATNLTQAERDGVHTQLARATAEPHVTLPGVEPRTRPPREPPQPDRSGPEAGPLGSMTRGRSGPEAGPLGSMTRGRKPELAEPPPAEPTPTPSSAPTGQASTSSVETQPPDAGTSVPELIHDKPTSPGDIDDGLDQLESDQPGQAVDAAVPAAELTAPRITESLQFILPQRDAVPEPAEGQSVLSRAVEVASPSTAATGTGSRVGFGSTAPVALSQLATEFLVRPDEGDETFEVTAGHALVIRVKDRILTRLDGIHVTGGELEYEPAMRRSRGHNTEDKFDFGGSQVHNVSGSGYLIAVPGDQKFTAVSLDDDILYVREDLVFAFEATLRWENGNVPGLRGKLPVVQFRGDGAVAMRTLQPLVRVKLPPQGVVYVDAMRLAGWIGRVIPRAVMPPPAGPMGDVCVECTGEGIVLIDPSLPPAVPPPRAKAMSIPPPPPQPSASPAELRLDDDDKRDEI